MKKFAIVVAGGSGTRMGTEIPKQFLELADKPILMHTIMQFHAYDENLKITLVLPEFQFGYWKELCKKYEFDVPHQVVAGGDSRFQSVRNGLHSISEVKGVVFIHDGVRPLVSIATIEQCFEGALKTGNALPVVHVVDSIREVTTNGSWHKDRGNYRLVQTPQTFQLEKIKRAFLQEESPLFTDDASVLEASGETINLVDGNAENIKITTPMDLQIADLLLRRR